MVELMVFKLEITIINLFTRVTKTLTQVHVNLIFGLGAGSHLGLEGGYGGLHLPRVVILKSIRGRGKFCDVHFF